MLTEGAFVWCAFPEREKPTEPGPKHITYVLATSGTVAMVAYTTRTPWAGALPIGVYQFDRTRANLLGQNNAFVMDLRRLGFLPITKQWFPDFDMPGHGIVGHMPVYQRSEYVAMMTTMAKRHNENIERLGPFPAR